MLDRNSKMGNGTQLIVPKNHAIFRNFHFIFSNVDNILIIDFGLHTKFGYRYKKNHLAGFYEAVAPNFGRANSQNFGGCWRSDF